MSVTSLDIVKKFPQYRNISLTEDDLKPNKVRSTEMLDVTGDSQLSSLIFAPDPLTGCPRSDLSIILSKDKNPELAQYIHDTLMKVQQTQVSAPDADSAINSVRLRGETFEAYATRLKEFVNPKDMDKK